MKSAANIVYLIRYMALTIILVKLLVSPSAFADIPTDDWRSDYKLMVQAYYANDYDKATDSGQSALNKVLSVNDQTEKSIGLEQIIRQLRFINAKYEQQQNYSQQEIILRCILKAEQANHDDSSAYQLTAAKKNLAVCLVLEGKTKEAETFLPPAAAPSHENKTSLIGWKKDLDLLTQANKSDNRINVCKYANSAVSEGLSVENATEKEVALTQINRQLQVAMYKYQRDKDYANEEKILKLMLKLQQVDSDGITPKSYQNLSTMKSLVTCLVMQGKDEEAATYNAKYREISERSAKEFQSRLQEQIEKLQKPKTKDSI